MDPRSFETDLGLIRGWIEECKVNHTICKREDTNWYPTRLLHFGNQDQTVKLIVSKDDPPKGPYVTLSHRWGVHNYEMLKPSTLELLKNGVIVSTLPQIFQEAIQTACQLGIHYLWIDSLCIMQGEECRSDWEWESQQMDQIYSNALFNISATLSENGSESLFQRRSWGIMAPSRVQIDVGGGQMKQYYVLDGDVWKDEVDEAPLSSRGWVFQERILAQRVIHFGPSQIGWECQELDALEMFPYGLPQMSGLHLIRKGDIFQDLSLTSQDPSDDLDSFVQLWQRLVSAYSTCTLTKGDDKLVAFLGVAKKFMQWRSDTYLAGMWGKTLIYDLAWRRSTLDIEDYPLRTTSSRAPSWSWASVDGEVTFPSTLGGVRDNFVRDLQLLGTFNKTVGGAHRCKVRIRGICLSLRLKWSNGEISGFEVAGLRFLAAGGAFGLAVALEDSERAVQATGTAGRVLFFPLFTTTYLLIGLILVKSRGVGAHLRVGSIQIPIMVEPVGESAAPKGMHREKDGNRYWSVSALKLRLHILEQQHRLRSIEIF